jgi:hypothetical protein
LALERQQGKEVCSGTPPVEFFDRIIDGRATPEEWNRWAPWLKKNLRFSERADLSPEESRLWSDNRSSGFLDGPAHSFGSV